MKWVKETSESEQTFKWMTSGAPDWILAGDEPGSDDYWFNDNKGPRGDVLLYWTRILRQQYQIFVLATGFATHHSAARHWRRRIADIDTSEFRSNEAKIKSAISIHRTRASQPSKMSPSYLLVYSQRHQHLRCSHIRPFLYDNASRLPEISPSRNSDIERRQSNERR
jgi:hypothetical protein